MEVYIIIIGILPFFLSLFTLLAKQKRMHIPERIGSTAKTEYSRSHGNTLLFVEPTRSCVSQSLQEPNGTVTAI